MTHDPDTARAERFERSFPGARDRIARALALAGEKRSAGLITVVHPGGDGSIPVLAVRGRCLPEAWENSLLALFAWGESAETQYDKPGDPPSLDCTMIMVVEDPLGEPMIHRSFPGGLEDLEEYRQEVVDGIKDHWIRNPDDPDDTRWEYTYHERMVAYKVPGLGEPVNQLDSMARTLARTPHTRRAQVVSWQPWKDPAAYDPACFQSLWGRILRDSEGRARLSLNMRFRSRDAYKAAFMNDFAFIDLARRLAVRVSELRGEEVTLGRFVDQSDSYHLYGSYFREFGEGFLKLLFDRESFEDRTWTTDFAAPIFEEAKEHIRKKVGGE
jgi:thymidylate synthase